MSLSNSIGKVNVNMVAGTAQRYGAVGSTFADMVTSTAQLKSFEALVGSSHDDTLGGGIGDTDITGGEGADIFVIGRGGGTDTFLDFQQGTDLVGLPAGIIYSELVFMDDLIHVKGSSYGAQLVDIDTETLTQNDFVNLSPVVADSSVVFSGSSDDDRVWGSHDADILNGGSGNDTLNGNDDADRILGRSGNDVLRGDGGSDQILAGSGNDVATGGSGEDTVIGGSGDDTLAGWTGDDSISGGAGDDSLSGGPGDDTISGGAGDDLLAGGSGQNQLTGDAGDDVFVLNIDDLAEVITTSSLGRMFLA